MSERTQVDDAIDDAIEELIDDDTEAFHLVVAQDGGPGRTEFVESWWDGTEKVQISDDLAVYKNTLMVSKHVLNYLDRIQDEHGDDMTLEDVFLSIASVLEEWDVSSVNMYELIGDYEQ
jgi:hypothetical protein